VCPCFAATGPCAALASEPDCSATGFMEFQFFSSKGVFKLLMISRRCVPIGIRIANHWSAATGIPPLTVKKHKARKIQGKSGASEMPIPQTPFPITIFGLFSAPLMKSPSLPRTARAIYYERMALKSPKHPQYPAPSVKKRSKS
jgi:hypothetical protein